MAVGKAAVQYALASRNATMPVIVRTSDAPYRWKIEAAPLAKIANREKKMPAGFIRRDGYGITAAARRYLEPLIRGEAPPPYGRDGLPKYVEPKRSEEHTSELQSLMRIPYAVFCLKKKKKQTQTTHKT